MLQSEYLGATLRYEGLRILRLPDVKPPCLTCPVLGPGNFFASPKHFPSNGCRFGAENATSVPRYWIPIELKNRTTRARALVTSGEWVMSSSAWVEDCMTAVS